MHKIKTNECDFIHVHFWDLECDKYDEMIILSLEHFIVKAEVCEPTKQHL